MARKNKHKSFEDRRNRLKRNSESETPHQAEVIPFPYEKKDIGQTVTTYASGDMDVPFVEEHLAPSYPQTDDSDYLIDRAVAFALETLPECELSEDELTRLVDKFINEDILDFNYSRLSQRPADSKERIIAFLVRDIAPPGLTRTEAAIAGGLALRLTML